jgi:hypothetical protein
MRLFCIIQGCDHSVKTAPAVSQNVGQSWYDHGVCTCCGIEFFPEEDYHTSYSCLAKIRKELGSE